MDLPLDILTYIAIGLFVVLFFTVLYMLKLRRQQNRVKQAGTFQMYSPPDGKVVFVIEDEPEKPQEKLPSNCFDLFTRVTPGDGTKV